MPKRSVKLHDAEGFARARRAGRLAAETLDFITPYVRAGVTLNELDYLCQCFIEDNGAIPAPLGYRGYPKANCISVNYVVCHGIPDDTVLQSGDILNIDVTVKLDGWHGDTSRMYAVDPAGTTALQLCDITYDSMMAGIQQVKPGNHIGDIGYAIQTLAESHGYSVVKEYTGHGINTIFHDDPYIPHWGLPGTGLEIVPGMIFTVEPMLNIGSDDVELLSDNWTVLTVDRSLSAQFEHMIGVTESGCEIFTLSPKGLDKPYSSIQ